MYLPIRQPELKSEVMSSVHENRWENIVAYSKIIVKQNC